jgi:hypothetical protein
VTALRTLAVLFALSVGMPFALGESPEALPAQLPDAPSATRAEGSAPGQDPVPPLSPRPKVDDGIVRDYVPITGGQRAKWFLESTVGPKSLLLSGPASAAWGTMLNSPEEYGPHWEGFGKRYGMRLTGVSVGNAIEATLGAAWGEDPRYFSSPNRGFGSRLQYVIKTTFLAPDRKGRFRPAYARFAGNVGNNFLSNTWRVDSENDPGDAALRCLWGVLGRMADHAFSEFWPDVRRKLGREKKTAAPAPPPPD